MADVQLFGVPMPSRGRRLRVFNGQHAMNVVFHIVNGIVLFFLLCWLTGSTWCSAAVAALFAVHPMHAESVAWASSRKELLATLIGFGTIALYACYGRWGKPNRFGIHLGLFCPLHVISAAISADGIGQAVSALLPELNNVAAQLAWAQTLLTSGHHHYWFLIPFLLILGVAAVFDWRYLAVVAAFALGLTARRYAVMLPLLLLLLDFWPLYRLEATLQQPRWEILLRRVAEKLPLLPLSAASSCITFIAACSGGGVSPRSALPGWLRTVTATESYCRYLGKLFWPSDLSFFYRYNLQTNIRQWLAWQGAAVVACALRRPEAAAPAATRISLMGPPHQHFSALGHRPDCRRGFVAAGDYRAGAVGQARCGRRYLALGWFWYLIVLVPVIGFVQVGDQSIADRYSYVSYIGLFVILAWGLAKWCAAG